MTAPWEETTLPKILARYQLKDIFNVDEFGLFYEAMPSKSLHFRSKRCSGGKHSKMRLTGMAASNPFCEKIPMFVIGPVRDASSMFVTSISGIDLKRKEGWMGHFLWNGCTSLIVSSKWKEQRLL